VERLEALARVLSHGQLTPLSVASGYAALLEEETDPPYVDEDGVTVEGDAGLLSELVENLLRNALEHGGPEPTVVIGTLEDGGGFSVVDDGPGIPPDVRDDVFGIGYTTAEGTDFGLDTVERIAEAHTWSVIESEEGGARFVFPTDD
jgi:signal transduction histidine kinase